MYEITLQEFTGPLAKLLELIENRHIEITQISLSEVTADFLKYINTIDHNRPEILAEFLPVAAKLLLIKSKAILPGLELTEEEDREIKNLQQQLEEYRRFKEAARVINNIWRQNRISHSRDFLAGIKFLNIENADYTSNFFYPPKNFNLNHCAELLKKLYQEIVAQTPPQAELIMKVLNLEEKIRETLNKLSSKIERAFSNIAAKNDLSDIVITFLAILHLFKEGKIAIKQAAAFEEIRLTSLD